MRRSIPSTLAYQSDDVLAVVNTDVCSGSDPAGCTGPEPTRDPHRQRPTRWSGLDPETQTLYTANQDDSDVSVIDATRCDAQTTGGCRPRAPEVPVGNEGALPAADPAVNTVYYPNGMFTVSMIDTKLCNASAQRWLRTDAADDDSRLPTGLGRRGPGNPHRLCRQLQWRPIHRWDRLGVRRPHLQRDRPSRLRCRVNHPDPGLPNDIAVNPATDTVYVATIAPSGPNLILEFNGATCNASDVRVAVRRLPALLCPPSRALYSRTTLWHSTSGRTPCTRPARCFPPLDAPFVGDSVYVINGAHCDASDASGCSQAQQPSR